MPYGLANSPTVFQFFINENGMSRLEHTKCLTRALSSPQGYGRRFASSWTSMSASPRDIIRSLMVWWRDSIKKLDVTSGPIVVENRTSGATFSHGPNMLKTGLTLFQCVLVYQPPCFPGEPSMVPEVDNWIKRSKLLWDNAHVRLQRATRAQRIQAGHRRRPHPDHQQARESGYPPKISDYDCRARSSP